MNITCNFHNIIISAIIYNSINEIKLHISTFFYCYLPSIMMNHKSYVNVQNEMQSHNSFVTNNFDMFMPPSSISHTIRQQFGFNPLPCDSFSIKTSKSNSIISNDKLTILLQTQNTTKYDHTGGYRANFFAKCQWRNISEFVNLFLVLFFLRCLVSLAKFQGFHTSVHHHHRRQQTPERCRSDLINWDHNTRTMCPFHNVCVKYTTLYTL